MSDESYGGFEADLAGQIFGDNEYTAAEPPVRSFKPWHRPRKQFVRESQWSVQTRKVLQNRSDSDPLLYLGLPGVDLIDLRYFCDAVCVPLERQLLFLGFNSESAHDQGAEVELNTSIDELRKNERVDPQSDVIRDDIRNIARKESVAWQKMCALGPFDVVNLDLCDGLASDDPVTKPSLYSAISSLLSIQVRNPNPWILLVTTRIGRDHFHEDALATLLGYFDNNLANCQGFAEQCFEALEIRSASELDVSTCSDRQFMLVTLMSICKWLLLLGQQESVNRVSLNSCYAYRVLPEADCEDLVSFALEFVPVMQPSVDALSIQPVSGVDECAAATQIAKKARNFLDVDDFLETNTGERDQVTTDMETLLRAARYDTTSYRDWLGS